jgi:hypothetical protein
VSGLNDWQARRVLSVFTYVDDLLRTVERLAREEDFSPFERERPDLSEEEADRVLGQVAILRSRMQEALARLDIEGPRRDRSARWRIQTALNVARMELLGLDAAALEGYGPVDRGAGELLEELASELARLVEQTAEALAAPEE